MINPNEFDEKLRRLLSRQEFVPFQVELEGGRRIWIRQPALAFGGGSAAFIDSEDGALVDFSHEEVVALPAAEQEVGA
jgi:hypothetical protein